jgi:hypothetical protein
MISYQVGKWYGKNTPPKKISAQPNTGPNGEVNPNKPLTALQVQQLTEKLWEDMDGISWFGEHNGDPYKAFLELGDMDKAKVINYWNAHFYNKNSETLYDAADAEYYYGDAMAVACIDLFKSEVQRISAKS